MTNPNWFGGNEPKDDRTQAKVNDATKIALEELEFVSTLEQFAQICQTQEQRREQGFRW